MLVTHQETVDSSVVLIRGITTVNSVPTRKCPICDVRVFLENYSTHQLKHTKPEEYEKLKATKEEIFQKHVQEQRIHKNLHQEGKKLKKQKKILNKSICENGKKKLQTTDHDYSKENLETGDTQSLEEKSNEIVENVASGSQDIHPTSNGTLRRSSRLSKRPHRYDRGFSSESDSEKHSNSQEENIVSQEKSKKIMYKCLMCDQGFSNIQELIEHDKNHKIFST